MSELTRQILKDNERFVKQSLSQGGFDEVSKYPSRNLAVLTCMDTRLLSFLEPAMGLVRGEAKLIKVAGNTAFEDFDSVIGSLMVAVYELHVHDIIVMGHDDLFDIAIRQPPSRNGCLFRRIVVIRHWAAAMIRGHLIQGSLHDRPNFARPVVFENAVA